MFSFPRLQSAVIPVELSGSIFINIPFMDKSTSLSHLSFARQVLEVPKLVRVLNH